MKPFTPREQGYSGCQPGLDRDSPRVLDCGSVIDTLAIIAPGLLGASVAQAARARRVARRIQIWARRPETRLALERMDWCDAVGLRAADAARGADLVVLCSPVDHIPSLAAEIAPALRPQTVVTDVGSTKGELCRLCTAALSGRGHFIGAHPMAGGEKSGMEHASPALFEGRPCFLTPLPEAEPVAADLTARFWSALGCVISTVTPEKHDEIVANISHLPHLLAAGLCAYLSERGRPWGDLAGNGLRDTTRIASGEPDLWRAIFESNRDEVLRALRGLQGELDGLHTALANRDWATLRTRLEQAKRFRDGLRPPSGPGTA